MASLVVGDLESIEKKADGKVYENKMLTSTVTKNDNAVKAGKMYKVSGVVRSVNQEAPPCLNDGIFSAMFDI